MMDIFEFLISVNTLLYSLCVTYDTTSNTLLVVASYCVNTFSTLSNVWFTGDAIPSTTWVPFQPNYPDIYNLSSTKTSGTNSLPLDKPNKNYLWQHFIVWQLQKTS